MIKAYLALSDVVVLALVKDNYLFYYTTYDYNDSVLNNLYADLNGMDVKSLNVVFSGVLSRHNYSSSVSLFSIKFQSTVYNSYVALPDVSEIAHLTSVLKITDVTVIDSLGYCLLAQEQKFCCILNNKYLYSIIAFQGDNIIGLTESNYVKLKSTLQNFVTRLNIPKCYDSSTAIFTNPEYTFANTKTLFNNSDLSASQQQSILHYVSIFEYTESNISKAFSKKIEELNLTKQVSKEPAFSDDDEFEETFADSIEDFEADTEDSFEEDDAEYEQYLRKPTKKKSNSILVVATVLCIAILGELLGWRFLVNQNKSLAKSITSAQGKAYALADDSSQLIAHLQSLEDDETICKMFNKLMNNKLIKESVTSVSFTPGSMVLTLLATEKNQVKCQDLIASKFVIVRSSVVEENVNGHKNLYQVMCNCK